MDAFTEPRIERITWMKSARVGYTKVINNIIGYCIHQDPSPILVVQPTVDDAKGYSKDEIAPMLRDTPCLSGLVADPKSRDSGNTIEKKSFPGGTLTLIGANSARGFRRLTTRVVLFDEVDGYPPTAGQEGDQIRLGIMRTETFWNRKIGIGSTPTVKGFSRVESSFEESDKGYYFLPCPDCGELHVRKFRHADIKLRGESIPVSYLQWPDGRPEEAKWVCPSCGVLIGYDNHSLMGERGVWIGETWEYRAGEFTFSDEFSGHIGFHIWAGYSYSPNSTPAKLANEFLGVKGDSEQLKTFVNTVLGETWEESGEQVEHTALYSRREAYTAPVPQDALVLVSGVDVQDDRLELEVVGFGEGEESWSVDYRVIWGDPAQRQVWDDLDAALQSDYQHESGTKLHISAACIDSGGHHTQHVYDFVKTRQARRVFAIKGIGGAGRPIVSAPSPKKYGKSLRPVDLFTVGVDEAKGLIYSRLKLLEPGPGFCHFPMEYTEEYFAQLTAEKIVTKYKKGFPYREWIKTRPRNEALDCRVYALAALKILNPTWDALRQRLARPRIETPPPKPVQRKSSWVTGWK